MNFIYSAVTSPAAAVQGSKDKSSPGSSANSASKLTKTGKATNSKLTANFSHFPGHRGSLPLTDKDKQ